jgi:hypothetical protein
LKLNKTTITKIINFTEKNKYNNMSGRMIFKSPRDSYFKTPVVKHENPNCSPILPYPRINTTKMIIHNYQNVNEGDSQSSSKSTGESALKSPVVKVTEENDEKDNFLDPLPKLTITKSENLFNHLNETSEFNIISSLNKISKKNEPATTDVEDKGFTRFSMNNVTNIYINYNFEKKKHPLSVKRARNEHPSAPIKINTRIFNIQDVRIMRKKIKQYFIDLEEYNIEIIEPIYAKKFAILNNKKYLKIKSRRHGEDNHVDIKNETLESESENTIQEIEHDHLVIQRKICLDELRALILSIQENYVIDNDKSKCRDLINRSVYYIDEINRITDRLKKSTYNVVLQVKKTKIKNKKGFQCDYCECEFSNGQALGGHMSRTHPNQSLKYNKKKMIRQEREIKRDLIYYARKELFANHNLDYEELAKCKENKSIVKRIRKDNMREYKEILDRLKKTI